MGGEKIWLKISFFLPVWYNLKVLILVQTFSHAAGCTDSHGSWWKKCNANLSSISKCCHFTESNQLFQNKTVWDFVVLPTKNGSLYKVSLPNEIFIWPSRKLHVSNYLTIWLHCKPFGYKKYLANLRNSLTRSSGRCSLPPNSRCLLPYTVAPKLAILVIF